MAKHFSHPIQFLEGKIEVDLDLIPPKVDYAEPEEIRGLCHSTRSITQSQKKHRFRCDKFEPGRFCFLTERRFGDKGGTFEVGMPQFIGTAIGIDSEKSGEKKDSLPGQIQLFNLPLELAVCLRTPHFWLL